MGRPSDHLLRTLAAVPPGARVLDLGAGHARHTGPLAALGFDVWACDAAPEAVAAARAALAPVLGEEEAHRRATPARPDALGYPDAFFDWVVARDVAPARAGARAVLEEARRVLKPGAWVWVTVAEEAWGGGVQPEALTVLAAEAGLALAERASPDVDGGRSYLRGIYRRVDPGTTA